jgi:nucleoside-diphosphate-sugar epimerase
LGSASNTRFIEMARLVAEAVPGTQVQQVEWPTDRYFVETGDYVSDIGKMSGAMGWRPRDLVEGRDKANCGLLLEISGEILVSLKFRAFS